MIDYKDLECVHKPDCNSKDSTNVEHRNEIWNELIDGVVEYDCHCKECGNYLYHFAWGHCEMY